MSPNSSQGFVASVRFYDSFSKLSFPVYGHGAFPSAKWPDRTVPLCASIPFSGPYDGSHFWSVSVSNFFQIFFFFLRMYIFYPLEWISCIHISPMAISIYPLL